MAQRKNIVDEAWARVGQYDRISSGRDGNGWIYFKHPEAVGDSLGWKFHISVTSKEAQNELAHLAIKHGILSFKFANTKWLDELQDPEDPQSGKTAVFYYKEKGAQGRNVKWVKFLNEASEIVKRYGEGPAVQRDAKVPGREGIYYRYDLDKHGRYQQRLGITEVGRQQGVPEDQLHNLAGVTDLMEILGITPPGSGTVVNFTPPDPDEMELDDTMNTMIDNRRDQRRNAPPPPAGAKPRPNPAQMPDDHVVLDLDVGEFQQILAEQQRSRSRTKSRRLAVGVGGAIALTAGLAGVLTQRGDDTPAPAEPPPPPPADTVKAPPAAKETKLPDADVAGDLMNILIANQRTASQANKLGLRDEVEIIYDPKATINVTERGDVNDRNERGTISSYCRSTEISDVGIVPSQVKYIVQRFGDAGFKPIKARNAEKVEFFDFNNKRIGLFQTQTAYEGNAESWNQTGHITERVRFDARGNPVEYKQKLHDSSTEKTREVTLEAGQKSVEELVSTDKKSPPVYKEHTLESHAHRGAPPAFSPAPRALAPGGRTGP